MGKHIGVSFQGAPVQVWVGDWKSGFGMELAFDGKCIIFAVPFGKTLSGRKIA